MCHNLFILQVEESTLDFESHLITIFLAANHNTIGMKTYVNVARSFNDIASETIISDTSMVVLGFSVVFMYVTFVMGKFDCIENRVSLQYILSTDKRNENFFFFFLVVHFVQFGLISSGHDNFCNLWHLLHFRICFQSFTQFYSLPTFRIR